MALRLEGRVEAKPKLAMRCNYLSARGLPTRVLRLRRREPPSNAAAGNRAALVASEWVTRSATPSSGP
jgi:hypothetical protein